MGGGVGDGQEIALTLKDVLHGGEGIYCIERGVEDGEDGTAEGRVWLEDGCVEAGHSKLALVSGKNLFNSLTSL